VSFDVRVGEVLGIVGRNGAGKSTLLKILSHITEPTTGYADIYGRVGSLLEVGTGFHQELTGRENVYMNGAILGMTKQEIDRKFDEIVAFADVERFIDTQVKRYSSGMTVRLAFAVAAHLEPELLIVDEVLAVGDTEFQKKCLGQMEHFAEEGRTVLFVSHNMPAVTRLCTRAILLEKGQMIADGSTTDIVATYLDRTKRSGAQRQWSLDHAPGTAELKLLSVSLVTAQGEPAVVAGVGEQLYCKIGYAVLEPGLRFRCVAKFHTQGVVAFVTIEPTEVERPQCGIYYSTVAIPPHLLAEGEYSVGISIFASRGRKLHYVAEDDVIAFQTTDPMDGSSARGDYAEAVTGVMRPLLQWDMVYAGGQAQVESPAVPSHAAST
jgi:lipopolysaccharide transport system ATP-binding protein